MVLVEANPDTFDIHTEPVLIQVIRGQTIDEIEISNRIKESETL